ncbi:MAG: polysaccharide deacetylase family protein [Actinobacteria bacterium]|nr:polysaccharide deacetylase family protein [Actinomycetota bacterium]
MTDHVSRRNALRLGAGAAVASVAGLLLPQEASAAKAGADIFHGPRTRGEVALTFHGQGDLTIARKILAISKKYNSPISVMAVGTWLNANPTIGHEIVDAGNDLGNHTYSHKTMTLLSLKEATAEVAKGKAAVVKSIGTAGKWFRPSGTLKSNANIRAAAGASGYSNCLVYDVDSFDYQDPSAKAIVATCMKTVQNGSIIGMHFGHAHTVTALPLLIQALQAKGLTPVTVTQLLR